MLIDVEHQLAFEYDDFVREAWMELRVEPLSSDHQTLRSFSLAVGPASSVHRYVDWSGNAVHHFGVAQYHDRVEVRAHSIVEMHPQHVSLADLRDAPAPATATLLDFVAFGGPVERTPRLDRLASEIGIPADAPLGEQVASIGRLLRERFIYRSGVTDYRSTTEHILEEGGGVCQDFAHLMLGLLRLRGIPCRYVSGYLHLERDSDEPSQSHAWIAVHTPDRGWVPFDPTHDRMPDERYVVVGHGRSYDDVAPNRGVYRGAATERLHAAVRTSQSAERGLAGFRQQIESLDVPVYQDIPVSGVGAPRGAPEQQEQAAQQQQ